MGSEAIERLHFIASLPLAGTGQREGGEKRNLLIASNPFWVAAVSAQRQVEHVKHTLQNILTEWTPHSVRVHIYHLR